MPEQISETNTHGVATPAWLDEEYVQQTLRGYLKDPKLQVQQMQIKPATANGENYASIMLRIIVQYTDKDQLPHTGSYLIKTTFADKSQAGALLDQYGIYVREMDMYDEVLPKLAKIIEEMGDHRKMFARTVNVDRKLNAFMLEDLSLEKYTVYDRIGQLDLEHTQLMLEKLAKFHAAAAVLNEKQPGIFDQNYDRCFFNKHTRAYRPIMQNMLGSLIESIKDDKVFHQKYAAKLSGVADRIMEYTERAMEVGDGDFATLCHGDIWTTNAMYNYLDSSRPNNMIMIDFQFSVWSSPATDLHYLFNTSLQPDLYRDSQTELVHFYHDKLVEALTKLKFKGHVPSLFQSQMQFQARAFYAIFCSLVFLPAQQHNGPWEFSVEKALSTAESDAATRVKLYRNERFQRQLRQFLPIFDHKGLLDPM